MASVVKKYLGWVETFKDKTTIFRGGKGTSYLWPKVVQCWAKKRGIELPEDGVLDKNYRDDFLEQEKTQFDSFKRQAGLLLEQPPQNDWEWLAVAQHSELPTRLLDWTKNPLAALYFSVCKHSSEKDNDCLVWAITWGELSQGHKTMVDNDRYPKESPLEYEGDVTRFIPPVTDRRMAVQQGLFTLGDPLVRVDKQVYRYDGAHWFESFPIKKGDRADTLSELHRLGVNQAVLFPDIYNLTRHLRWVWENYR